jgi:hypothetical protein
VLAAGAGWLVVPPMIRRVAYLGQVPPPPSRTPTPPPAAAPSPGATGIPQLDALAQTSVGRAIMIGGIAATAARVFPGKIFAPLLGGFVAAWVTGLAGDVKSV